MNLSNLSTSAVVLIGLLSAFAEARGADWPQWRGPKRDGISTETGLLKEWPKEGPKLLWRVDNVGAGYSTSAIAAGRIFVMGNEGMENEFVMALAVADGKQIWKRTVGKVGNPDQQPHYPAARSTPTVEGDVLYALGSDGDLVCLETKSGEVKWKKNLRSDFEGQPGKWAYSESPLIDGDALICTPGGSSATMVALKKLTGEVIWKCAVTNAGEAAYSSAMITEVGGVKQYVQFVQKALIGVAAKDGKLLWRYERTAKGNPANIPTATVEGDRVYSAGGRSGGGGIQIKQAGDQFEVEELYFSPKLPTSIGGTVKVGDSLFGTTGRALLCVDFATGNVRWEDPCIGASSVCVADARLYLHGENGDLALIEANPEKYVEKGRFTPPDQPNRGNSKAWAYPVIANGKLYIRDANSLWCYDVKPGK